MESESGSVPTRLASTAEQIENAAATDTHVLAAWLEGSLATGTGDDWSDLDVHLLIDDLTQFDPMAWIANFTPAILADEIPGLPGAFIFVTPGWVHIDVIVHTHTDAWDRDVPRRALWDPHQLVPVGPATLASAPRATVFFPDSQAKAFLYFMGTVVGAVRRGDWLAASLTAVTMRDELLLSLMLAENGVAARLGRKHLDRLLTTEQLTTLGAIPPIGLGDTGLVSALTEIATLYIARGRRLAEQRGTEWPTAFCDATVRLWADELGIELSARRLGEPAFSR